MNAAAVVLVSCAVVVTGLLVRRELFPQTQVRRLEPKRVAEWKELSALGHQIGQANAPVIVTEFSDYQCPFCASFQDRLKVVQAKYPDAISLHYRHLPLERIHPFAFDAARAAACADDQGRFEAYHDLLFTKQDSIGRLEWSQFAELASIPNLKTFEDCMKDEKTAELVRRDMAAAKRLGLNSTPIVLINDLMLAGTPTGEELEALVTEAMNQ